MRIPKPLRLVLGFLGILAVLAGVMVWMNPAQFSGATTGDFVECDAGACQVYQTADARDFPDDVEHSDLPKTLLFEGTEAEVDAWSAELDEDATRPIALGLLGAGALMLLIALIPGRRRDFTEA